MGETQSLANFVADTTINDIPPEVLEKSKEAIIDYTGVALYGSQHEVGERVAAYASGTYGPGPAQMFARESISAPGAALANGAFGHAIDFDDTFESIVIHPSSPVFAAACAMGEDTDATGSDVLTAYVVGVDTAYRTGHSTYPSHYDNGWHSTGTVGTFGATAAAASILDLSAEEICSAFGIAASCSSSLKKNFGTMTKPLHAGHAGEMGVRAALLAHRGFTSDSAVFEGGLGYGNVMTVGDTYDPSAITDDLKTEWAVMDIGYKPYPSGVITHAAMDALRDIVIDNDIAPGDVESIVVSLDDAASEMLHHEDPQNALEAKFSIEFCLASVLRVRDPGIHEFTDEYVTAPETRAEMEKISRDFEPNLFGGNFANYAARVTIVTTSSEEFTTEEKFAPGHPNNPISQERLEAKFRECVATVISEEEADDILDVIAHLDEEDNFARFREHVSA